MSGQAPRRDDVTVTGNGLAGWRVPAAAAPGALFLHGWDADRQEMAGPATEAAALGFSCLAYDLRGHGATRAERHGVTPRASLDDATAAFDLLAGAPGVDRGAMAVVGTSFGAWLALMLTARRPVRWLALRVPALYPDACMDRPKDGLDPRMLERYRRDPPPAAGDRALAAAEAFGGEVLVVWSGNDERLPPDQCRAFRGAFPNASALTVRRIAGADHALGQRRWRAEYRTLLRDWLQASIMRQRHEALAGVLDPDPA